MADDKVEGRELSWRHLMPWTVLFRAFRIAASPSKLLLAAAGIFVMAIGWWLLSVAFEAMYPSSWYTWDQRNFSAAAYGSDEAAWKAFRESRAKWNLFIEMAGNPDSAPYLAPEDVADSLAERNAIK